MSMVLSVSFWSQIFDESLPSCDQWSRLLRDSQNAVGRHMRRTARLRVAGGMFVRVFTTERNRMDSMGPLSLKRLCSI